VASRGNFNCRDFVAPRARWAPPGRSHKLRDGGIVPLICPTCQNVFAGKASTPAIPCYFAWGCFRYFGWEQAGLPSRSSRTRGPPSSVASSPSSLSLRSSYAGHHASPFVFRVAAPRVAQGAKRGGPGRTRTCNQTVMSGRRSISFVDSAAALFDFDHVRCVSISLFLVRNWCGCPKLGTASIFDVRRCLKSLHAIQRAAISRWDCKLQGCTIYGT